MGSGHGPNGSAEIKTVQRLVGEGVGGKPRLAKHLSWWKSRTCHRGYAGYLTRQSNRELS